MKDTIALTILSLALGILLTVAGLAIANGLVLVWFGGFVCGWSVAIGLIYGALYWFSRSDK